MRSIVALALLSFGVAPAMADAVWSPFNGNRLIETCESNLPLCEGYILGLVDARYTEGTFCLGPDVETAQIVDTVTRYLDERPELGHVAASAVVVDALADKFPCR